MSQEANKAFSFRVYDDITSNLQFSNLKYSDECNSQIGNPAF